MPQYIKKEGEVIYSLEYPTEKPDINRDYKSFDDYKQALEAWHKSAVKTPFHESQKEEAKKLAFTNSGSPFGTFQKQLTDGIIIPDGLCEKKQVRVLDGIDDYDLELFAFIKESKPVEETNEEVTWSEFFAEFEKGKKDFYGRKNITSYLKSKFTITRK